MPKSDQRGPIAILSSTGSDGFTIRTIRKVRDVNIKKSSEVFGVSSQILPDSYVDRGQLDQQVATLLQRPNHIALRGASKCGKSWIRQRLIQKPIVVQCRHGSTVKQIYAAALSQLDISTRSTSDRTISGGIDVRASAQAGGGFVDQIIGCSGDIGGQVSAQGSRTDTHNFIGNDLNDLRFVADCIKNSGRRLVIEDFHYLAIDERKKFAFDLKALWDYNLPVMIVGVWSQSNMLIFLNPDLTGRVDEVPIEWGQSDLAEVLNKGGHALNIRFGEGVINKLIGICYGNVGILQKLALGTLDECRISEAFSSPRTLSSADAVDAAAMAYAEQLNPLYQRFAAQVSNGMRKRKNATGIYAHAMAIILQASDELLIKGLSLDAIFEAAHSRESRIQRQNLASVLSKFERLQVDEDGRGLVLSYNDSAEEITVVDRQLLLYRMYSTVRWPWENLIIESTSTTLWESMTEEE